MRSRRGVAGGPGPLIITGFHRSGTSMLAQALAAGGLDLGDRLIAGAPSNPDGHFEDSRVVRLHAHALKAHGLNWMVTTAAPVSVDEPLERRFRSYVALRAASGNTWGFKDPRACLFLPLWDRIAPGCRLVAIYRHYWECTESLLARASRSFAYGGRYQPPPALWRDPTLAPRMWCAYNRALLAHVKAHPESTLVVSQPSLLSGLPVARAVREKLGIGLETPPRSTVRKDYATAQPVQAFHLPASLLEELEFVWNELQALAGETRAPGIMPGHTAWYRKTETSSAQQRLQAACQALVRPRPSPAAPAPASARDNAPAPLRRRLASTIQTANRLARRGQPAEAEKLLRPLVTGSNPTTAALLALGTILRAQGRNDEARRYWERSLDFEPVADETYICLAELALDEERLSEANRLVAQGLARYPGHVTLILLLSRFHRRMRRRNRAIRVLRTAIDSGFAHPRLFISLAQLLERYGRMEAARRVLDEGIARFPRHPDLTAAYATALSNAGEMKLALESFEQAYRYAFEKRNQAPRLIAAASRVTDPAARLDLLERMVEHVRGLNPVRS